VTVASRGTSIVGSTAQNLKVNAGDIGELSYAKPQFFSDSNTIGVVNVQPSVSDVGGTQIHQTWARTAKKYLKRANT
jgi:hypothetical protein